MSISELLTPWCASARARLVLLRALVRRREDLPRFMRLVGYESFAEIGVAYGANFRRLLESNWSSNPLRLALAVDPWTQDSDRSTADPAGQSQAFMDNRAKVFAESMLAIPCVKILRMTSLEAAAQTPDDSLDLVYIDGDHRYAAVIADIQAWWPKVRSGGLLCGHDYAYEPEAPGYGKYEVKKAVDEWVAAHGLQDLFMTDLATISWYVVKP